MRTNRRADGPPSPLRPHVASSSSLGNRWRRTPRRRFNAARGGESDRPFPPRSSRRTAGDGARAPYPGTTGSAFPGFERVHLPRRSSHDSARLRRSFSNRVWNHLFIRLTFRRRTFAQIEAVPATYHVQRDTGSFILLFVTIGEETPIGDGGRIGAPLDKNPCSERKFRQAPVRSPSNRRAAPSGSVGEGWHRRPRSPVTPVVIACGRTGRPAFAHDPRGGTAPGVGRGGLPDGFRYRMLYCTVRPRPVGRDGLRGSGRVRRAIRESTANGERTPRA